MHKHNTPKEVKMTPAYIRDNPIHFYKAEVGEEVFDLLFGKGRIITIIKTGGYPLVVEFPKYKKFLTEKTSRRYNYSGTPLPTGLAVNRRMLYWKAPKITPGKDPYLKSRISKKLTSEAVAKVMATQYPIDQARLEEFRKKHGYSSPQIAVISREETVINCLRAMSNVGGTSKGIISGRLEALL